MGAMAPWHWAIVIIVLVLVFGSKKLPDAARGIGRSLRIFKSEISEMRNDEKPTASEPSELPPGTSSGPSTTPTESTRTDQQKS